MRTIEQYLPEHPFFSGLDASALALVAGCATNVTFAAGEFLFREGQPANQFFVVRRGRVAVEVHGPATGTMVIDTADAGDVVGWSWLVPPYKWLFDARAVEATGAVAFDGQCLRGKCEEDPGDARSVDGRAAATARPLRLGDHQPPTQSSAHGGQSHLGATHQ